MVVADAHALADRLERDHEHHPQDLVWSVALIRALLRGRAPGDVIEMES